MSTIRFLSFLNKTVGGKMEQQPEQTKKELNEQNKKALLKKLVLYVISALALLGFCVLVLWRTLG
jgi:hypothetical protein